VFWKVFIPNYFIMILAFIIVVDLISIYVYSCKIRPWSYNFLIIHVNIEEIKRRAAIQIKLGGAGELYSEMSLRQHTFQKTI